MRYSITAAAGLLGVTAVLASAGAYAESVEVNLNDLRITIDRGTGAITRMVHPDVGKIIDVPASKAGIVDLACPIPQFDPLRLASRFSRDPRIDVKPGEVTISWARLGASRTFDLPGAVSAVMRLKAAPDGRSVALSCDIDNQSQNTIRQVLFPDLLGVLPFGGTDRTHFRTARRPPIAPFRDMKLNGSAGFYAANQRTTELRASGPFDPMNTRWMDLSSHKGGFSLYPRRWGWDPKNHVYLKHSDADDTLRIACLHPISIAPGQKWSSGEFWLTPHESGWAKGIESYREWVKQNWKRDHPVPDHVRDGIGYRTLFMCQGQPGDPNGDVVWKFSDLPRIARESKEFGIDELLLWWWGAQFQLPIQVDYPHLGTEQDLVEAIAECRKLGVNVSLFISVCLLAEPSASKYTQNLIMPGNQTYHLELVPSFGSDYSTRSLPRYLDQTNVKWHEDILSSCKHLIDIGCPSISWDQYFTAPNPPNVHGLTSQIRAHARKKDPQSTFAAEMLISDEIDGEYLDYTWNWGGYHEARPYTSVFKAPRLNACISASPVEVKLAFADNMYINLMPTKDDGVNGDDLIVNHPEMAEALRQCVKLRKQFLPYFTDGTLIGDCILSDPCDVAQVSAYVRPTSLMVVAVNRVGPQQMPLQFDLSPWLKSNSRRFEVKSYDADGNLIETRTIGGSKWKETTKLLQPWEIAIYEVTAK